MKKLIKALGANKTERAISRTSKATGRVTSIVDAFEQQVNIDPNLLVIHTSHRHYYTRSSEILRSLNWINLEDRRAIQFKKLMYKTANNMVPSYLTDKFIRTSSVHEYNLRGANHNFFVPRALQVLRCTMYALILIL